MKLHIATALALLTALSLIFFYAPIEANQGVVQKIFYVHVACAITMYLGFFVGFLASLFYLVERKGHWDEIAVSAVEIGFFLCTIVLLTGPIWAKPIWGAWWTWDARLTTTLLAWLLYSSYMVLRSYFGPTARGRIVTAVVAIISTLNLPLIHYSVKIWRGIHPTGLLKKDAMPSSMQMTMMITFFAVLLLFCSFFRLRLRLERSRNRLIAAQLERAEES